MIKYFKLPEVAVKDVEGQAVNRHTREVLPRRPFTMRVMMRYGLITTIRMILSSMQQYRRAW